MLPSKPKCMLIGTALGKPLLKIGTMYVNSNNVVPLHLVRLPMNFHPIWGLFTVQATKG